MTNLKRNKDKIPHRKEYNFVITATNWFFHLKWMVVQITQSWVKQTALKDTHGRLITKRIWTWKLVGIVSKELRGIGCRTNVLPFIAAALGILFGLMVHTRRSLKEWWHVQSVLVIPVTAVGKLVSLKWRTAALTTCMSYRGHVLRALAIVVTSSLVSYIDQYIVLIANLNDLKYIMSPKHVDTPPSVSNLTKFNQISIELKRRPHRSFESGNRILLRLRLSNQSNKTERNRTQSNLIRFNVVCFVFYQC